MDLQPSRWATYNFTEVCIIAMHKPFKIICTMIVLIVLAVLDIHLHALPICLHSSQSVAAAALPQHTQLTVSSLAVVAAHWLIVYMTTTVITFDLPFKVTHSCMPPGRP